MNATFFRLYRFKANIQLSLKGTLFAQFVWIHFQVLVAL